MGRIAQQNTTGTDYFLADALGSVRQLTDESGAVTLAQSYTPYGEAYSSEGSEASSYGFTGEWRDSTGMIYLRARYYAPWDGRFTIRDAWGGDYEQPLTLNKWIYVGGNPIMLTDPSGECPPCWLLIFLGLALTGCSGGPTPEPVSVYNPWPSPLPDEINPVIGPVAVCALYLLLKALELSVCGPCTFVLP